MGNKSMAEEARTCNKEKTVISNAARKTGQLHAKERNQTTFLHCMQKQTQNGLKT